MPRDQIDLRILDALERNARIPHAELAEQIHLSRNALRARIERLERDGEIAGYTIRRCAGRDQAGPMVALIFVYRQDRLRGAEVLVALRRIPEVISCDVMSGEFDIVLRLEASAADRIRAIWQQIASMPGVRDTLTSFALSPYRRS
jgi:Lrp/AsnC family leucine-responsive transcriptional regulator